MADRVLKGVANIWVPVADIERAVDFYENTLGLEVTKRDGPWAEVDANEVTIGLNGREPEVTQAEGGPVLTFQNGEGSLEEAVEELKSRGVEFPGEISDHDWGRVATFPEIGATNGSLFGLLVKLEAPKGLSRRLSECPTRPESPPSRRRRALCTRSCRSRPSPHPCPR